jgi:hypothetical protein
LKKELNGGVIVGVLVVVGLVVVVLAWRVLGPPGPAGIKPFDKQSLKEMQQKHGESAAAIRQQQQQLLQQRGGGQ